MGPCVKRKSPSFLLPVLNVHFQCCRSISRTGLYREVPSLYRESPELFYGVPRPDIGFSCAGRPLGVSVEPIPANGFAIGIPIHSIILLWVYLAFVHSFPIVVQNDVAVVIRPLFRAGQIRLFTISHGTIIPCCRSISRTGLYRRLPSLYHHATPPRRRFMKSITASSLGACAKV